MNAFELLAGLRAAGWQVAAHNDYRLGGVPMTSWLFTHPSGRWVKGEGETDAEALDEASHMAVMFTDAPVTMREPYIDQQPPVPAERVRDFLQSMAGRVHLVPVPTPLPAELLTALRNPDVTLECEPEVMRRVREWLFLPETPPDPHVQFAAAIFAKPAAEVTGDEYERVRQAAYFLTYGGDPATAATELGVPVEQVKMAVLQFGLPPVDFAVVAGIGGTNSNGIVIHEQGDNIEVFVESESIFTRDMGLGPVPPGISIWEGVFHLGGGEGEAKPLPKGAFRPPTEAEWAAIREGRSPWA